MAETRQQVKERLQAAGQWMPYLNLRERLVKDGLTPAQAREQALHEVESRPGAQSEQPAPTRSPGGSSIGHAGQAPIEQPGIDFAGQTVPNREAVEWVAENIANASVAPGDAPSGVAWGLLAWIRRTPANESTFWGSIWAKQLPTGAGLKSRQSKAGDESDAEPDIGTERSIALCEAWLQKFGEMKP